MALHTVELSGDNGADSQGPGLAEANSARITRLRAQAEALQATPEPNLFGRWTFNAIRDLDQAARMRDDDGELSEFLELIEEELSAAQRAHDRQAARVA